MKSAKFAQKKYLVVVFRFLERVSEDQLPLFEVTDTLITDASLRILCTLIIKRNLEITEFVDVRIFTDELGRTRPLSPEEREEYYKMLEVTLEREIRHTQVKKEEMEEKLQKYNKKSRFKTETLQKKEYLRISLLYLNRQLIKIRSERKKRKKENKNTGKSSDNSMTISDQR